MKKAAFTAAFFGAAFFTTFFEYCLNLYHYHCFFSENFLVGSSFPLHLYNMR